MTRLEREGVSLVKLFTPAPYPGTRYHAEMKAQGRIVDDDWARYDYASIAKRMLRVPRKNPVEHAAYLVANLKTWQFLKRNPSAWGTIS